MVGAKDFDHKQCIGNQEFKAQGQPKHAPTGDTTRVEASIGGYKRTYHGVVRRQGNNAQTLFMYWD